MPPVALRPKGFLILVALAVLTFLLVLGMGLMSAQQARYRGLQRCQESAQARQLALSALEDVRLKLEMDPGFPPNPAEDQPLFNYSEEVNISGQPVGSYEVLLDRSLDRRPYGLLVVVCTGTVGPKERPVAQRTLRAELRRIVNDDPAQVVWRWVSLQDLSGY